eukprot:gene1157-414_t
MAADTVADPTQPKDTPAPSSIIGYEGHLPDLGWSLAAVQFTPGNPLHPTPFPAVPLLLPQLNNPDLDIDLRA